MKDPFEQVHQYIETLLEGRRPRHFTVDDESDLDALQVAARLTAEREPAGEAPSPEFLARLQSRLVAPGAGDQSHNASRRNFLAAALGGVAAGLGAGFGLARSLPGKDLAPDAAAAAVAGASQAEVASTPVPLIRNNGRWFPVATLSELTERGAVRFTAGALEGHLVRNRDEVVALSAICSHLPCTLVWQPPKENFLCPCHDVSFSKDGEAQGVQRPLPPLTKMEVKVENGEVFVWSIYLHGAKPSGEKLSDPYRTS